MIYADTSFLFSLYAWDANSAIAAEAYLKDQRRPLLFTPWQQFELKNVVRLILGRLQHAGQSMPFQSGNVFKTIRQDLDCGRLKHAEPDWRDTMRLAEQLSNNYTSKTGAASVDVWHVAAAVLLEADVFWTFDSRQQELASLCGKFKRVPKLPTA